MFGLKSGKVLKEFRGHIGNVNDMIVHEDTSNKVILLSCGSDGIVNFDILLH